VYCSVFCIRKQYILHTHIFLSVQKAELGIPEPRTYRLQITGSDPDLASPATPATLATGHTLVRQSTSKTHEDIHLHATRQKASLLHQLLLLLLLLLFAALTLTCSRMCGGVLCIGPCEEGYNTQVAKEKAGPSPACQIWIGQARF